MTTRWQRGQRGQSDVFATVPGGDAVEFRLRDHRRRLSQLMRSPALTNGDIASALADLTELSADLMCVERASVWQLSLEGQCLECVDLYTSSNREHGKGATIQATSAPAYFDALFDDRALAIHDARHDPRTREFDAAYLTPLDIYSMLDAPVFLRGRLVGVVCFEHVAELRHWHFWEELVAASLGDFVALVLQAREQLRVEAQVREMRSRVDDLVEQRTHSVVLENADLQREVDSLQLAAEAIRKSEDDLRRLFAASPVAMLLVRRVDRCVIMANDNSAAALRCQTSELRGRALPDLFAHRSDHADVRSTLDRTGSVDSLEVELRALTGESFWALLSGRVVFYGGEDTIMLGFHDLTAQKAVEHQLRFLAQRDPLTQAFNRHHFWQLASTEMQRVQRYGRPVTIAMIDADHFKNINDTHGHDVGDLVLRMIVDTCMTSLRTIDVLARYGGEEFIVLLPETNAENALVVMERIRERIADSPVMLDDGVTVRTSVSIGIAGILEPREGLESLLKRADDAMYAAKREGRNRVLIG